jgi:hypothetical protein
MDMKDISDGLDFEDLQDEEYRIYTFSGGESIKIENPIGLNVSESGGHRIYDSQGISHYIPYKWIHLYWKVKSGHKPFAF